MIKNVFFQAEDLGGGVWRITTHFDSHARMMTYSYLVEGEERAMVVDTMFGYGNLRSFCRELTDKPLILVNTHYHGDHAGGNFDFDECYIHAADIPFLQPYLESVRDPAAFRAQRFERMKNAALPEYRDRILDTDFSMPHPMNVWPIYDGDVFDLGGRRVEVIHVGGHTAGEIVLLDDKTGYAFSGDACNNNTLLNLPGSISVEEYYEFLQHFKTFQPRITHLYGGHEDFDNTIIDEALKLTRRVLDGTDDREERSNMGRPALYGARHNPNGKGREDGHDFNIAYTLENLHKKPKTQRVL